MFNFSLPSRNSIVESYRTSWPQTTVHILLYFISEQILEKGISRIFDLDGLLSPITYSLRMMDKHFDISLNEIEKLKHFWWFFFKTGKLEANFLL